MQEGQSLFWHNRGHGVKYQVF